MSEPSAEDRAEVWARVRKLNEVDAEVLMLYWSIAHHMPDGATDIDRLCTRLEITFGGPRLTGLFKHICGGKPLVLHGLAVAVLNELAGMTVAQVDAAIKAVLAGEAHQINLEEVETAVDDFRFKKVL